MSKAIERARGYSDSTLVRLRSELAPLASADDVTLVTCGSFARREASSESDLDFFGITQREEPGGSEPYWFAGVRKAISQVVPTEPAAEGAFSHIESMEGMAHNVGGENDTNQKMTRRILFLLEGEWLTNESGFRRFKRQLLERYIGEGMTDHQLALFLLNDIIRYYRTVAVEYEFKTNEGDAPKPWGIRNIKLVFSRKLLYASGLFSVALTADQMRERKIEILENLFALPVLDRMVEICGKEGMAPVVRSYSVFLEQLEKPAVRARLKELGRQERGDPLFRDLKNEGHHLTRELLKLFERTFDSTHPIHRAVIF